MIPGEYILKDAPVTLNKGRIGISVDVVNLGDRPVQVGSHFHFYEVNEALQFDRQKAYGMRLDIPSGTAVRFEPGIKRKVELIPYEGQRVAAGFNGKVNGKL